MDKEQTQVSIDPHGLDTLSSYVGKLPNRYSTAVIISDEEVFSHYGQLVQEQLAASGMDVFSVILPSGENSKSLESAYYCWENFLKYGIDRKSLAVTLGGGVISDVGGFVASTYMRGIDLIHLPTSFIGMIDAAIGGKTALNFPQVKNIIGTFYHPRLVLIDSRCLQTLPQRDFLSGIAELIKYGVIADPHLFGYLEQHMEEIVRRDPEKVETVISRACEIKSTIVMQDIQDQSVRAILNYGHTIGHALETASQYSELLHGEAVAIGMSCAAYISHKLGYVDREFIKKQDHLQKRAGLEIKIPETISIEQVLSLIQKDKKAVSGKLSFILSQGIGRVVKVDHVDPQTVAQALEDKRIHDL